MRFRLDRRSPAPRVPAAGRRSGLVASASARSEFLVDRSDLRRFTFIPADPAAIQLRPGEVLLRVDKFGFSANNITYAMLGEVMGYW